MPKTPAFLRADFTHAADNETPEAFSITTEMIDRAQQAWQAAQALYQKHLDITVPESYLDEALDEYARALELSPGNPQLLTAMAQAWMKKGKLDKANALALQAIEASPRATAEVLAEAYYIRGFVAYKYQAVSESIRFFGKALQAGGLASSRARYALAWAYQNQMLGASWTKKPWALLQSVYYFATAGLLFPWEPERYSAKQVAETLSALARIHWLDKTGKSDDALEAALAFYRLQPGSALALHQVGRLYQAQGDAEKATFWLMRAQSRDPLYEDATEDFANLLEATGNYEAALDLYRHLLHLTPNSAMRHCQVGNLESMRGHYEAAIQAFQLAMTFGAAPGSGIGIGNEWKALLAQSIGIIYQDHLNNPQAAKAAFQQAMTLVPGEVEHAIHLGMLHFETEAFENALAVYRHAITMAPGFAPLYAHLAYILWHQGKLVEAEAMFCKAIELDPEDAVPYNNLGVLYLDHQGRVQDAIALFQKAIEHHSHYALAYYNLGRACSLLGQNTEAAHYFQHAGALNQLTHELNSEELHSRLSALFNTQSD